MERSYDGLKLLGASSQQLRENVYLAPTLRVETKGGEGALPKVLEAYVVEAYVVKGPWYGMLTICMVEYEGLALVTLARIAIWSR